MIRVQELALFVLAVGVLACATGSAPERGELRWPPEDNDSPAVLRWAGQFSELETGGFTGFLQKVAGAEGENEGLLFGRPVGLAVHDGTAVVVDTWFVTVVRSDFEGQDSKILSLPEGAQPNSVAFSDDGSAIFVGDGMTGAIYRVDLGGGVNGTLLEEGVLERCGGLVSTVSGGVVATDPAAGRVVRLSADGEITQSVGGVEGPHAGAFNTPTALTGAPDGSFWMVDTFNYRVVHLSPELEILDSFGRHGDASGDFALPKGIALDPDGHIYVSDAIFDVIQVFDTEGRLLLVIGGHGTGRGQFLNPAGLAFDSDGTLLVADSGNRRVQVLDYRPREVEQ